MIFDPGRIEGNPRALDRLTMDRKDHPFAGHLHKVIGQGLCRHGRRLVDQHVNATGIIKAARVALVDGPVGKAPVRPFAARDGQSLFRYIAAGVIDGGRRPEHLQITTADI